MTYNLFKVIFSLKFKIPKILTLVSNKAFKISNKSFKDYKNNLNRQKISNMAAKKGI